jgi:hypothetical protein
MGEWTYGSTLLIMEYLEVTGQCHSLSALSSGAHWIEGLVGFRPNLDTVTRKKYL